MTLRWMALAETARPPTRALAGDAGYDLHSAEAASLGPGARASVGTGIAIAIPLGLAGLVLPRSGLAARHGLTLVNAPGLIDSGFRGEVRVLLLNTDLRERSEIAAGERIAQLLLIRHESFEVEQVESLDRTDRGERGFGSTGR